MEQAKLWLPKLLAGIVAIVLVLALFNIIKAFLPTPSPEIISDLNYGLNSGLFEDEEGSFIEEVAGDFSGYLYFDSLALPDPEAGSQYEDATEAANIYAYDFVEGATIPLIEVGESFDGNPFGTEDIAYVTAFSDESGNLNQTHIRLNTTSGVFQELAASGPGEAFELAVSPKDPSKVAFVFRDENPIDQYNISNFSLFFDNPYVERTITIEEAASPAWTMGGDVLVFLKGDGIYAYDLKSDMTAQLSNAYTNLSAANQLAVSASSTFAVLTLPALNAIAVFEPNTSEAGNIIGIEETGLIQSDGVTYKTPVISPDDRFYAVVASRDTESGTERSIEIRHNLSRDVVGKVTPDGIDQEYLNLSAWSDIKVNPLPLQPENLSETIELD